MSRKLYLLLVTLMASGLIAIGCGDDDDDGGGSDEPAKEESSGGGNAGGGTGGADVPENVDEAVESCKKGVNSAPQLSADVKSDLEEICEKAGEGDEDAVREASRDVCVKIVEETVPAGAARDQAKDACEQAGVAP